LELLPIPEKSEAGSTEDWAGEVDPIGQLGTNIAPPPPSTSDEIDLPDDHARARFAREGAIAAPLGVSRPWMPLTCLWVAPGFCHQPLYFEDVNLERVGYYCPCIQPVFSAGHFFGTLPLLPYKMTVEPPRECIYTLGHYRPGSHAPPACYFHPPRADGIAVEGAVVTGLIFLIP
jgi:hypothetical protein